MKRMIRLMVIGCLLQSLAYGADYYLDGEGGRDGESGLSPARAWKTLERVNQQDYQPGDRIRIKAGGRYVGQLRPKGSGKVGKPIVIESYGEGARPVLDGGGSADAGGFYGADGAAGSVVYLKDQEYWEISGLEICNRGKDADYRRGVRVEVSQMTDCHHIYLRNLYVHDVNGLNSSRGNAHHELSKQSGGIFLCVTGEKHESRFVDVLIEGCEVRACDRSGISVGARAHWYKEWNQLIEPSKVDLWMHQGVVIRNNAVEDVGGDGIVVQYAKSPLIEYNVCRDAAARSYRYGQYSAGIWPWMCEGALFQYNEVGRTHSLLDGQGFDCDSGRGTVYQYNYSYENEGGFMLFCKGSSVGSVVRYNISRDDRYALFTNSGGTAQVYNNVFILGKSTKTDVNFPGASGKMEIKNNVFYHEGECRKPKWAGYQYEANLYVGYDELPKDERAVKESPQFVSLGSVEVRPVKPLKNLSEWNRHLKGYQVLGESPCKDQGVWVEGMPEKDFFGNRVEKAGVDIGIYQAPKN